MRGGIVSGIGPGGKEVPVKATQESGLEVDVSSRSDIAELLRDVLNELRLLRLGMCAANDAVCVDLEGELTPLTTSEE